MSEHVPLHGVVSDDWGNLVREEEQGGAINRISYEWCVLTALREKVRCKEVWVRGAHRFRNPDEDLPQDFEVRRDEYYMALGQPLIGKGFVEELHRKMEVALTTFDASLPANPKVKIVTTKKGKLHWKDRLPAARVRCGGSGDCKRRAPPTLPGVRGFRLLQPRESNLPG